MFFYFNPQRQLSFLLSFRNTVDFLIQISKNIGLSVNPVVSVLRVEVTDMNFISIVPNDNQKTYTDDIEDSEFQIIVCQP